MTHTRSAAESAAAKSSISATLEAVHQGYPNRRVLLAFQPHRYSRTLALIDDFAAALSAADLVCVTEVYAAGETPIAGADGRAICRAMRAQATPASARTVFSLTRASESSVP